MMIASRYRLRHAFHCEMRHRDFALRRLRQRTVDYDDRKCERGQGVNFGRPFSGSPRCQLPQLLSKLASVVRIRRGEVPRLPVDDMGRHRAHCTGDVARELILFVCGDQPVERPGLRYVSDSCSYA
jgi:hypothetical protein